MKSIVIILLLIPSLVFAINLEVKITGVDAKLADNIRNDLHLQQAINEPKLTVSRIRNLYDLSAEQINTTLQAKGYYQSKTISELNPDPGNPELWVASFHIQIGQPTRISSINLKIDGPGKNDPRIQSILSTPLLKPGRIFTHEDYENTKKHLISELNSVGYLQADFTENIVEVDREKYTANIKLDINTGMLYVFGNVKFIGGVYPDSLLNRYLAFKPGQPYEIKKLAQLQDNLEKADLYSVQSICTGVGIQVWSSRSALTTELL